MNTQTPPDITSLQKTKKGSWLAIIITAVVLTATSAGAFYWVYNVKGGGAKAGEDLGSFETDPPDLKGMRLGDSVRAGALQIEEDTEIPSLPPQGQASGKNAMPKGFGLTEADPLTPDKAEAPKADQAAPAPAATLGEELADPAPTTPAPAKPETAAPAAAEEPVALQTPVEPPKPKAEEETSGPQNTVQKIDPREVGVTTNDGPEKEYEETALTVQRTLTAVMGDDRQMIRLKVPVMYKSRTLRLEGDTLTEARRIHAELKAKTAALASLKVDLEKLLSNWNDLVRKSTPADALLPESPTLPENQSAGNLNRKENPDLEPGKAITYEIVKP
jgi:hypothetical protein